MSEESHETPPHLTGVLDLDPEPVAEQEPAPEFVPEPLPNFAPPQDLQDAMTQLVQLMTIHFHGQQQAQAQPAAPAPQQRSRVKTRDPDPYDGTDPSKLRAFLSQCRLTFRSRPNDFSNDQIKITYAVSWLKGTALRWYEPNLSLPDRNLPNYARRWDDFEDALKATFGEPDPVTSATTKLDNLSMKDTHHITRYNVEFNEYAALTGYNDQALYTRYYKGLAPRLKDALVFSGKPTTLNGLRTRAQALDLRYWERKDEERPHEASSSRTPAATSTSYSSSKSSGTQSKSAPRASTPGASTSKTKKPNLSNVLGPDGKLLPEEKERRKKQNLCLICASKDHFSDKCPARKTPAKARAAAIEEVLDEEGTSEDSLSEAESSEVPN